MAQREQNIIGNEAIFQGDSLEIRITCTEEDGTTPFDLTDPTTVTWTMYDMSQDPEISKISKTLSGGGITLSGSSNEIATVKLDPADTELPPRTYTHFLVATAPDYTQTLSTGTLEIDDTGFVAD